MKKFQVAPPPNLARLHRAREELGHPEFTPPRTGQIEEQMTDHNVRAGFSEPLFVDDENGSAYEFFASDLATPNILASVETSFLEIIRNQRMGVEMLDSTHNIELPPRRHLSDKDKWFDMLASDVPLKNLVQIFPGSLDWMHLLRIASEIQVPYVRTIWAIKVLTKYMEVENKSLSFDGLWDRNTCQFLLGQLDYFDAAKWDYSVRLTKYMYDDGLLGQRFLRDTLLYLTNEGDDEWRLAIWLFLVQTFLFEYQRSISLMRLLLKALFNQLTKLRRNPDNISSPDLPYVMIKNMLQGLLLTDPDTFVLPRRWFGEELRELIRTALVEDDSKAPVPAQIKVKLQKIFEEINERNEIIDDKRALTTGRFRKDDADSEPSTLTKILDNVKMPPDYQVLVNEYFSSKTTDLSNLEKELFGHIYTLCYWAVTHLRSGDHRVYIVSNVLTAWKNNAANGAEKNRRQAFLQNALLDFLDKYSLIETGPRAEEDIGAVSQLFAELIGCGHFSNLQYMYRLISRGDFTPSKIQTERTLRHIQYIRWFPMQTNSQHQLSQRRRMLGCVDNVQDTEFIEKVKDKIKEKLSHSFGDQNNELKEVISDDPTKDFGLFLNFDRESIDLISRATKFVQLYITKAWLMPAVKGFVLNVTIDEENWRNPSDPGSSLLSSRQFSIIVEVLELTKDYNSLIEAKHTMEKSMFLIILDIIKRHEVIWEAMNKMATIVNAFLVKTEQLRKKNAVELSIVKYLRKFTDIPADKKAQLEKDLLTPIKYPLFTAISRHRKNLGPVDSTLMKIHGFRISIASNIDGKWIKSESTTGYLYVMLDACVRAVSTYKNSCEDFLEIRRVIIIFGDILREIGDRTPLGLDGVMRTWLINHSQTCKTERMDRVDKLDWDEVDKVNDRVMSEESPTWFLLFIVTLVSKRLVSIKCILHEMCDRYLTPVAEKMRKHEEVDNEELNECVNSCRLLGLLLVQGGLDYGTDLRLTIMEIQALKTQCKESDFGLGILDMLSVTFHNFAIIETLVHAQNSKIANEIEQFQMALANTEWFVRLCTENVSGVHDKFIKASKKYGLRKVESRMIDIVQLSLGSHDGIDGYAYTRSTNAFINYFKTAFSQIDTWNFEKRRIEFSLVMDQIMVLNSTGDHLDKDGDSSVSMDVDEANLKDCITEYFWKELVLQGRLDCDTVSAIVKDVRPDIARELFEQGMLVMKTHTELIPGIEEVFRSLLSSVKDNRKIDFCEVLLEQVQVLVDSNEDNFERSLLPRIKCFLLVIKIPLTLCRQQAVVSSNDPTKESDLLGRWIIALTHLLGDRRIHQNGAGVTKFRLILDLVTMLHDEMPVSFRNHTIAKLRQHDFTIPPVWGERVKRVLPWQSVLGDVNGSRKRPWELIGGLGEDDDYSWTPISLRAFNARLVRNTRRVKRRTI